GNIVFFKLLLFRERRLLRWGSGTTGTTLRGSLLRALVIAAFVAAAATSSTASTGTAVAAAEELEVLDDDRQLAALPAALLVFPTVELETSFDEKRTALLAVLVDHLGLSSERGAVDEGGFLAVFALRRFPLPIGRETELDDR